MLDGEPPPGGEAGSSRGGITSRRGGQPRREAEPAAGKSTAAAAVKLLLVDDERAVRLLLRRALKDKAGFEVVGEAANGVEALRLAAQLEPDIVVMDAKMPLMDGIAATRLITQRHPEARVLAYTSDREALASLVEAGAVEGACKGDLKGLIAALEDLAGELKRGRGGS